MLPKLFSRHTFEHHPGLVARTHARMARTPARAIAGTLRGLAIRPDRTGDLAEHQGPRRSSWPALEDQLIPIEESERVAGLLPDARLVKIPDAGHLAPLENHRATDAAILEFLERHRH